MDDWIQEVESLYYAPTDREFYLEPPLRFKFFTPRINLDPHYGEIRLVDIRLLPDDKDWPPLFEDVLDADESIEKQLRYNPNFLGLLYDEENNLTPEALALKLFLEKHLDETKDNNV